VVSFVSYYWFISLHFWTLFMLRTSTNLHLLWDAYIYRTEDTGHERPASKASRATMRREPSSTASKCKLKLKYLKQRLASLLSPSPSTSSVVLVVLASSSSPSSSASSLSCSRACYPGNYVPIRVVWDFRWEVDEECARAFPLEGEFPIPGSATGWRKYKIHQRMQTPTNTQDMLRYWGRAAHSGCVYRMRENVLCYPRFAVQLTHWDRYCIVIT